jgi:hypothetical protein
MAPAAFWANTVRTDEVMLRAINGILSKNAFLNVLKEVIFPKGYQSKMSRTTGRLTAIGLLMIARVKKARVKKYVL